MNESDSAFREVTQSLKDEQRKKILRRVAPWIGGSAIAIVVAVAVSTWYQGSSNEAARNSAQLYLDLITSPSTIEKEEGEGTKPNPEFARLAEEAQTTSTDGYKVMVGFATAAAAVERGELALAVSQLMNIARDPTATEAMQTLALIKAGLTASGLSKTDSPELIADVTAALTDVAASETAMSGTANEILALSAYERGDLLEARRLYASLAKSEEADPSRRYRTTLSLRVLTSALPSPRASNDSTTSGSTTINAESDSGTDH